MFVSQELFSKAYDNVGVLFASIPNFTQFYSEDVNRGMECIRLLNEIIGKLLITYLNNLLYYSWEHLKSILRNILKFKAFNFLIPSDYKPIY